MAKSHKVSMFVLDINEESENVSDLIEYAFSRTSASTCHIEAQTVVFPWHDDIILNKGSSTKQDYENFMDEEKRRYKQVESILSEKFDLLKNQIGNILNSSGVSVTDENIVEFMKQMSSEVEYRMGD